MCHARCLATYAHKRNPSVTVTIGQYHMHTRDKTDLGKIDPGKDIPSVGQEIRVCFPFEMKPVAPEVYAVCFHMSTNATHCLSIRAIN